MILHLACCCNALPGNCLPKTAEIVQLLLDILQDEEMRCSLGAEFTSFIVRVLFGVRAFWLNSDREMCHRK
jgi:hypothetical protein